MAALKLYSTKWCTDCMLAKQFLRETGIEFEEVSIDDNPEARKFLVATLGRGVMVPVFDTQKEIFACKPFDAQLLMTKLGLAKPSD